MKAIVVKQPWATLIVGGHKDIENRTWSTSHRGPLLIQSSARVHPRELAEGIAFAARLGVTIEPESLVHGAIVGIVEVVACVRSSSSPWFFGPVGWTLRNGRQFRWPIPNVGRLGIFDAPAEAARLVDLEMQHRQIDFL